MCSIFIYQIFKWYVLYILSLLSLESRIVSEGKSEEKNNNILIKPTESEIITEYC